MFSGHCAELQCDKSCPILAQTAYLLDRNEISMNSPVFKMDRTVLDHYVSILNSSKGQINVVTEVNSTTLVADGLTYCAICENWKGSQLHCTAFNLKFSKYLDTLQQSWSGLTDSSGAEYLKIWATSAKVLIISNIDYINFKDFQAQKLLSLLDERVNPDLTTIIVSPPISNLIGDGPFFARLTEKLKRQRVV